jgi:hypothetical protein
MAGKSMAGQQTGAKRRVARAGIDVRYLDPFEQWEPKPGRVLVHSSLTKGVAPKLGQRVRGFRYWEEAASPTVEPCPCGWRPEWGQHYRIRRAAP